MTDRALQHPLDWSSPRHRRIALGTQIAELAYELRQREKVYPRLAAKGRKQSELDYHSDALAGARRSLEWLRDHEMVVRAAAAHDLGGVLAGALHALRSYEYGNAAPDLAAGAAARLEAFMRAAGAPPDPIHESPSNRDASTDGKASSPAAPQGEAGHAGTGSETPAGHEGRHSEAAGRPEEPAAGNAARSPAADPEGGAS